MRLLTAIAILAATGLAACTRFDGPQATDRGHSISVSRNSVTNYTLPIVDSGDRTPITRHRAPPTYPGGQRCSTEQGHAEPQPRGRSPAHRLLAFQNSARAAVGEQPLVWSTGLADVARQWANHLIATGAFKHHVGGHYGENLYDITGGTATPRHVVSAWVDERRDYDVRTNSCSGDTDCGHYTQIVWSRTRAVGCALAANSNRQVWVCEYYPAGNIIGYRPYQVVVNRR